MTDISREAVEALRSRLVHQCNAALSMPVPMTGIAEISRQAEEMIAALRAEVDALEAKLVERVTVKPLEFEEDGPDCIIAGDYSICHETHGYQIYRGAVVLGKEHATRAKAEAKAQADHKSRTTAAITTAPITPAEEFVAKVQQHEWQHDEPNDRADLPEDWLDYIEEMELFCNWVGMCAQKASALHAIARENGE